MVGLVLVVVASGLSILTLEAVAESARSGARHLVVFGHEIASPGSPGGTWILIGLAVAAALAWSAAIAWSRVHRLERRMAAELDGRRDLPPRREATRSGHGSVTASRPLGLRTAPPPERPGNDQPTRRDELAARRARRATHPAN